MVLALRYMAKTKTAAPAIEAKARRYVAQGYKKLRTFESKKRPGGFALWVDGEPTVFLTAYGLMQFVDMGQVHPVEPALLERMKAFLRAQQLPDGSFTAGNLAHRWGAWKETPFYMTAYVAWALARAGEDTSKALAYLRTHRAEVEDPYGVALAGLAFAAANRESPDASAIVTQLLAQSAEAGEAVSWGPVGETFIGGRGLTGRIETTAMVALLLQRTGQRPDVASRALDTLVGWRTADGRFGSTHSTALALRALLRAPADGALPATRVMVRSKGKALRGAVIPANST